MNDASRLINFGDQELQRFEGLAIGVGVIAALVMAVVFVDVEPTTANDRVHAIETVLNKPLIQIVIDFARFIVITLRARIHHKLRNKSLICSRAPPLVPKVRYETRLSWIGFDGYGAAFSIQVGIGTRRSKCPNTATGGGEAQFPRIAPIEEHLCCAFFTAAGMRKCCRRS